MKNTIAFLILMLIVVIANSTLKDKNMIEYETIPILINHDATRLIGKMVIEKENIDKFVNLAFKNKFDLILSFQVKYNGGDYEAVSVSICPKEMLKNER